MVQCVVVQYHNIMIQTIELLISVINSKEQDIKHGEEYTFGQNYLNGASNILCKL